MGYRIATLGEQSLDNGKYGIAASAVDFDTELPAYLRITDINDDGTLNKLDRKSVNDPSACKYMLSEGSYSPEQATAPAEIIFTIHVTANSLSPAFSLSFRWMPARSTLASLNIMPNRGHIGIG